MTRKTNTADTVRSDRSPRPYRNNSPERDGGKLHDRFRLLTRLGALGIGGVIGVLAAGSPNVEARSDRLQGAIEQVAEAINDHAIVQPDGPGIARADYATKEGVVAHVIEGLDTKGKPVVDSISSVHFNSGYKPGGRSDKALLFEFHKENGVWVGRVDRPGDAEGPIDVDTSDVEYFDEASKTEQVAADIVDTLHRK